MLCIISSWNYHFVLWFLKGSLRDVMLRALENDSHDHSTSDSPLEEHLPSSRPLH